ncbi:MAG: BACON domain-containing protein [Micrococcales bacterium]|nr:BACON domain-containing protein [Micrococcales bacterium]
MSGVRRAFGLAGAAVWGVVLASTVSLQITTDLPAPLELDRTSWSLDPVPGDTTVEVQADGEWVVGSDRPWLTVSPASGSGTGRITLRAAANNQASARWATVSVTDAGSVRTVMVNQAGDGSAQVVPLNLGEDGWDVGPHSGTTTVPIASDREWTASSDQPWLTVTPTGTGRLALSVVQNTGACRSATVRVDDGTFVRHFVVNQEGASRQLSPSLQVGASHLDVDWDAGTTSVLVSADGAWTVASDEAWMTASASNSVVVLTWARNPGMVPRTGTVRVMSGGATRVLQVDQAGQTDRYAPEGKLEKVVARPGQVQVKGRAVDRDQPATDVQVDVYVKTTTGDQTFVGSGATDRADGDLRSFDFTIATSLLDGLDRSDVCIMARSVPSGAEFFLGCSTIVVSAPAVGTRPEPSVSPS